MFELFKDELDSNTYECVEDFNADVIRISTELSDELGKTERLILSGGKEVLDDLGVWVKGVNDDEEGE